MATITCSECGTILYWPFKCRKCHPRGEILPNIDKIRTEVKIALQKIRRENRKRLLDIVGLRAK